MKLQARDLLHSGRGTMIGLAMLLTICLSASSSFADSIPAADPPLVGHQGFSTFNPTTTDTGNVNTATTFSIPNFTSTFVQDGIFAGFPSENFGTVVLNLASPTSFSISSTNFGTFTAIAILSDTIAPAGRTIGFVGQWTPGAFFTSHGLTGGPFLSDFNFAFSQVLQNGPIQAIGTFGTPSTVIPEPSTYLMGLTGIAPAVMLYGFRRRRRHIETA